MSDISLGGGGGLGSLLARVGLDTSHLASGVAKARAEFSGLESHATSTGTGIAGAFSGLESKLGGIGKASGLSMLGGIGAAFTGGAAALDFIGGAIKDGIEKTQIDEAVRVLIRNAAAIGSTVSEHAFDDIAAHIAKTLVVPESDIKKGLEPLLNVPNLTKPALDRLATLTADASAAVGKPVDAVALAVSRIGQAPEKASRALRALGIVIDKQTEDAVKGFVAQGDTAGATNVILGDIEKRYHGVAEATGKAAGPQQHLAVAMKELQEKIGVALLPLLQKLTPVFEKLAEVLGQVLPPILDILVPALGFIADHIEWVLGPLTSLILLFKLGKAAIEEVGPFFEKIGKIAGDAAKAVGDGIGDALDWISSLPGKIADIAKGAPDWLLQAGKDIISGLLAGIEAYVPFVWGFWTGLPGRIWDLLKDAGSWLIDTGSSILHGLLNGIGAVAPELWGFYTSMPGRILDLLGDAGSWLLDTGANVIHGLVGGLGNTVGELWEFLRGLPGQIADIASGMWDGITNAFRSAINELIDLWNGLHFDLPAIDWGPIHLGGGSIDVPQIPHLHTGGIVPGRPGQDVLAVLQAGERVLSLQQLSHLDNLGGSVRSAFANLDQASRSSPLSGGAASTGGTTVVHEHHIHREATINVPHNVDDIARAVKRQIEWSVMTGGF